MSGLIKSIVSICIAISLIPSYAFAGGQTQRCKQAGEQAQKQCMERNAANNAADQATGQIRSDASAPGQNTNAVTGLQQNAEQQARVKDTLATCEAAQKKCEQECQSAAQTAGADDNQMMPHNPDGEYRSQVDGEKQNTCIAPLMAAKGDGMAALAALAAAAAAMMATKGATDKDKTPEEKEKEREPACEGSEGTKYAHCNDHYVSTCTANMSAPGCDVFASRYCGTSTATTPTNDTPLQTGNDNVIGTFSTGSTASSSYPAGAAGEGANTDFCRMYIAGKLCTFTENGKCKDAQTGFDTPVADATGTADTGTPSTSLSTQAIQDSSDPFSSSADRFSASGSAASAGGGSGGGLGGDAGAAAAMGGGYGAVAESAGGYKVGSIDPGGGGGGGGYSGSNGGSGADYSAIEASRNPAAITGGKVASAAALTTAATDVAKQYGPSVFSISSITYQSLCSKNKLNCK